MSSLSEIRSLFHLTIKSTLSKNQKREILIQNAKRDIFMVSGETLTFDIEIGNRQVLISR